MNTNQNKNLEEQSEEDGLMADIELQTNKLLILIKKLDLKICYLEEQFRHKDDKFIKILKL